MSEEIVVYTNPMSRSRIVRWMLEEVGQPCGTEVLETAIKAGPFILGEWIVHVGSQIGGSPPFKALPERPSFAPYSARITARSAAKRAGDLDKALIPSPA